MTYRLMDAFGSMPTKEYPRRDRALQAARERAMAWNRSIVVIGTGKFEWIVHPNKQVTRRPR